MPVLARSLAFAATLLIATLVATPATAGDRYVALGDSYSSGLGTGAYTDAACGRSSLAFPAVVARERPGTQLAFAACSGARTTDVLARQLAALRPDTTIVTITVGGNDAGFADVLRECAKPSWLSDCAGRVRAAQAFIRDTLPGRLDALYARIRLLAPQALGVAVGYPRLFSGRDCNLLTWFSADDRARLNTTAELLASTIRGRARARGLAFADPIPAFTGHAVCDRDPWLNGLSTPLTESYHPNAAGQRQGLAPLVRAAIG
ncbi:MAG TPA: SGNH/GDSL hydrolase family protein [Solirubrobacteraceae bacterium]|nr:SGNH/GDSL hydrolase family protein [Solirubrobacteraceae bacterium]